MTFCLLHLSRLWFDPLPSVLFLSELLCVDMFFVWWVLHSYLKSNSHRHNFSTSKNLYVIISNLNFLKALATEAFSVLLISDWALEKVSSSHLCYTRSFMTSLSICHSSSSFQNAIVSVFMATAQWLVVLTLDSVMWNRSSISHASCTSVAPRSPLLSLRWVWPKSMLLPLWPSSLMFFSISRSHCASHAWMTVTSSSWIWELSCISGTEKIATRMRSSRWAESPMKLTTTDHSPLDRPCSTWWTWSLRELLPLKLSTRRTPLTAWVPFPFPRSLTWDLLFTWAFDHLQHDFYTHLVDDDEDDEDIPDEGGLKNVYRWHIENPLWSRP